VQLVPCVDVLSPFISAINKVNEFRVGLKEQAGARVACGGLGGQRSQRCVKQQGMSAAELPGPTPVARSCDPARQVCCQQRLLNVSGQAGLVDEGHKYVVPRRCGLDSEPERTGHTAIPFSVDHYPNPALLGWAQVGGSENLSSLRTKYNDHFPASTVEQYLGKYFDQCPAAERKQSLWAQA
jgi:hypothetical protein